MGPSWLKIAISLVLTALFYCLKLDVLKKLRLGGLQARFWRPQASILEGLGLIFRGFGRPK